MHHNAKAPITIAAASATPEEPETELAAPVKGVPVGAGGTTVDFPVDATVAFAVEAMLELAPVTSGIRTGVVVVATATEDVDEARTTVL